MPPHDALMARQAVWQASAPRVRECQREPRLLPVKPAATYLSNKPDFGLRTARAGGPEPPHEPTRRSALLCKGRKQLLCRRGWVGGAARRRPHGRTPPTADHRRTDRQTDRGRACGAPQRDGGQAGPSAPGRHAAACQQLPKAPEVHGQGVEALGFSGTALRARGLSSAGRWRELAAQGRHRRRSTSFAAVRLLLGSPVSLLLPRLFRLLAQNGLLPNHL
mmetsp:Transcript_42183/g.126172  ORF Transcript_42183/g.126172 Transcript_42183/m.126172 type:complete len:220 (+) Transcript_42183:169-828(+)